MSELSKAYDPKPIEKNWYEFWEVNGFFTADPKSKKPPYSIVLPPPNVTGVLHMGHGLVNTLQDVLIRWKRMSGFETLFVPGLDHAGIATQTVVEKHLIQTTGKRRKDFSREEFLKHVWTWKEQSEKTIVKQLKMLGCSLDWSRQRFTMDDEATLAVRTVFKKMYDEGLIYRGDYLVNWDPVTQTALADDEVEYEQREGSLWHFKYPIEGSEEFLVVATTRPETMLGDTAVAVNPKDKRYAHLVGKQVRLPLSKRFIPIIEDHYVDPEFGSGAVKITPAHDHNDYEIGLRHELPMINIMTPDGKINGMTVLEAREWVVGQMNELGLVVKIEPHAMRVGLSYRSKAVIEPYLSKQWFVKMTAFKQQLIDAVKKKHVKLVPENWESTYLHWIENLRDWCISRQLWWGHRIPIWYKDNEIRCELNFDEEGWTQDEDVLDTWFSSALWPFSSLGWPNDMRLMRFYPNSTLVTGHDILFFWVARMMLMGEYVMGQPPFPKTFLHGLIYGKSHWKNTENGPEYIPVKIGEEPPSDAESKWEKMSKSKGNVIDPIKVIEMYGADAMRLALCSSATYARQIDLDMRRFEEYRNFINKMWNAARFVFMNVDSLNPVEKLDLEDKWILSRLDETVEKVTGHLEAYQFDHAAQTAYEFFWDEYCAYYVEICKKKENNSLLLQVLIACIRLFHPMAPFITEELFQFIKKKYPDADPSLQAKACIVAPFPTPQGKKDLQAEEAFEKVKDVIHAIRNIRAEMQIPPSTATDVYLSEELAHETIVRSLVKIKSIHVGQAEATFISKAIVHGITITIPLPKELVDKEKERQKKEKEKLTAQIASLEKQLENKNFIERAPAQLVEKTKQTLEEAKEKLSRL